MTVAPSAGWELKNNSPRTGNVGTRSSPRLQEIAAAGSSSRNKKHRKQVGKQFLCFANGRSKRKLLPVIAHP
jgi:hypothetical protein